MLDLNALIAVSLLFRVDKIFLAIIRLEVEVGTATYGGYFRLKYSGMRIHWFELRFS